MRTLFLECALRAALIVAGTAVVLWITRVRTAAGRHAAWTVALLAMLVLPIWFIAGPRLSLPVLRSPASPAAVVPGPPIVAAPSVETAALREPVEATTAPRATSVIDWQTFLIGLYVLGACALLARLLAGTIQARRLRRSAVAHEGRMTSPRCAAPITVGWLSPMLILPVDWERWPKAQLDAVLTHEGAHARRRDPLVQWLALLNRAVFWFQPLAWWLERRLTALAEEACDAAVLAAGHSPQDYSQYLLDLARAVLREGHRVNVVGMAMPGSHLKPRLRRILDGMPKAPTSKVRLVSTVVLAALASVASAAATLGPRAQASPSGVANNVPKFDVVSVKPCDPKAPMTGRGGNVGSASPGRLHIECEDLFNLVNTAFVTYANGRLNPPWTTPTFTPDDVRGWMTSDRFTIDATGDATAPPAVMRGPMLQAALEDRFKLKVRRESREVALDELVVAKGGSKLTPWQPGACVPNDWSEYPYPPLPSGQHRCETVSERASDGQNWVLRSEGMTLDQMSAQFSHSDRPVINKTGIVGVFSFRIVYVGGGNFKDAVKDQLGLEMRPSKGPHDFLVIDHAERPTPNESVPAPQATTASASSKFDVVSIKPCKPAEVEPGVRGGKPGESLSPNRMHLDCAPLVGPNGLIRQAYVAFSNGQVNRFWEKVEIAGAPAWTTSERYTIDATSSGAPGLPTMRGPMLQKVLEDRFRLQIHRETKPIPVYELTVAKGGPKLKPFTGGCTPVDLTKNIPAQLETPGICMFVGQNDVWDARGENIDGFISMVLTMMDRPIIDKTGLTGRYDIHLKITPDEHAGPNELSATIAVDLQQQLGLKLTPATGPGQLLVVDHVERPTPDGAAAPAIPPARARGAGR